MKTEMPPLTKLSFETTEPVLTLLGLEFVQDIIYFDGPLLAHYRDKDGLDYFYHWLDVDAVHNRWAIYSVSAELPKQVINDPENTPFGPLESLGDGLLIADIDDNGKLSHVYLYHKQTFPQEYLS